jgi:hypothetical protein
MGAPSYMSPEQARGSANVTVATDVYGVGATLYAMLTGHPPFQGDDPVQTLQKVVEEEPIPPRMRNPRIDRDLETICLKCMEKQPETRYASAGDLATDLHRFLIDETIMARPVSVLEQLKRWKRKHPARATAVLAAAFVLLLEMFVGLIGLAFGFLAPEFLFAPILLVATASVLVKPRMLSLAISAAAVILVMGTILAIRGSAFALIIPSLFGVLAGFLIGTMGRYISALMGKDVFATTLGAFFGWTLGVGLDFVSRYVFGGFFVEGSLGEWLNFEAALQPVAIIRLGLSRNFRRTRI